MKKMIKIKKNYIFTKIQTISEHIKQFIIETSNSDLKVVIDESRPFIKTGDYE